MKLRSIAASGLACVALVVLSAAASAQGRVVQGVPCNQQASYDLCVKCIKLRGGGGATGGSAFCSNTWRPKAPVESKKR